MGAIGCINCVNCKFSRNEYGQISVDALQDNQEEQQYQYAHGNTKTGTGLNNTFKKRKTFKFDKKDFVRMKSHTFFEEYEIKERLGEGAYGSVYKVLQITTGFLRAVKAIKKKKY